MLISSNNAILIKKIYRKNSVIPVFEARYIGCIDNYCDGETEWALMDTFYTLEEAIKYGQQQGTEYGCIFSGL